MINQVLRHNGFKDCREKKECCKWNISHGVQQQQVEILRVVAESPQVRHILTSENNLLFLTRLVWWVSSRFALGFCSQYYTQTSLQVVFSWPIRGKDLISTRNSSASSVRQIRKRSAVTACGQREGGTGLQGSVLSF